MTARQLWYRTHNPVVSPKKPEKRRIVFDCAAQVKGASLNSVLMQGPGLVNNLTEVLTRFRKYATAIIAEIEVMFLEQVRLTPRDRDCVRFLWWRDGGLAKTPTPHRMKAHSFGAT